MGAGAAPGRARGAAACGRAGACCAEGGGMSALPKSIYKYPLQPRPSAGVQVVEMPTHAQILDCQMVGNGRHPGGGLILWALVDTTEPVVKRAFVVYPTGGHLPMEPGRLVATVQAPSGVIGQHSFIWNVFEVPA